MRTSSRGPHGPSRRTLQTRGLVAVAALGALAAGVYGSYTQAFSDPLVVTLESSRAGLLLEPGADVALRNVAIGQVGDVDATEDGARIELLIDRDQAEALGVSSGARIVSPTLLGPKYVDLTAAGDGVPGLRAGDVISADEVQVEANAAFEDLVSVLDGIRPASLDTALGAVSRTLADRGVLLGDYLTEANAYFDRFNAALPTMERDLDHAAEVTRIYADLAPDLLAVLDSTTTTGDTVARRTRALDSLLMALEETSDTTRGFLADNRVPLRQALELLRPTATTLARYAPMFPCMFAGLNDYREDVEKASGGIFPGLWVHLSVLPGADPYGRDELPVVRADAPGCSGGPLGESSRYVPRDYDDGARSTDNLDAPLTLQDRPSLAVQLFGTEIAVPPLPDLSRLARSTVGASR